MAATVKNYKFTYENGTEFKIEQSLDGADYTTIIEMTENGDIKDLFNQGISKSLKHFFEDVIDKIVETMAA